MSEQPADPHDAARSDTARSEPEQPFKRHGDALDEAVDDAADRPDE